MKKAYSLLFIITFISFTFQAQSLIYVDQMGGDTTDIVASIFIDSFEKVYTTGYFKGTSDFDPGNDIYNLNSYGTSDVFVSKLDANGDFEWAISWGGEQSDEGTSICIDKSGNIYTTGYFSSDTVDFDPGENIYNLFNSDNYSDIFISKLNSNGNFEWAVNFGGYSGVSACQGRSIKTDSSGNVYIAGIFSGTIDFDPSEGSALLYSPYSYNIFILKLNTSGDFIWAKQLKAGTFNYIVSLVVDKYSNVYASGSYQGIPNDFDPGEGEYELNEFSGTNIFISKLDSTGDFVWAKALGGISNCEGYSIDIDYNGNVLTAGTFFGSVDFDPGNEKYELTSYGNNDIFISKLDSLGDFVWAHHMGGSVADYGSGINVDKNANVYLTGGFRETVDFDPGPEVNNVTSAGGYDIFISKFDADGNFIWNQRYGGIRSDFGETIVLDSSENVYCIGDFREVVDFDPGLENNYLTSNGDLDIFILKLDQSTLGVEVNNIDKNQIYVFPNPSKQFFNVNAKIKSSYRVVDLTGNVLLNGKTDEKPFTLDLRNFASGIYYLIIENQNIKLIKQ